MHTELTKPGKTEVKLTITAAETDLTPYKNAVLKKLAGKVKIQGFRQGTAPISLVEKNIDPQLLQTEFLDTALSSLYIKAADNEKIRPVTKPEVSIKKFVPFTSLEFEVVAHVLGEIKLPDYKKIKLAKEQPKVTKADVENVLESLQKRMAEKTEVKRQAKNGDQAWIDFRGVDEKGEAIKGADGKDYPLLLGSKTFIPGFEDNVAGMKTGEEKTFDLTFPKDYSVKALAGKKVKFTVKLTKVEKVTEPKINDEFAGKVGPFKTVEQLKEDIKKQLQHEKQHEVDRAFQAKLLDKISASTSTDLPEPLIEQQITYLMDEFRRNLTYRGQTYPEFLESEKLSEEDHRQKHLRPQAEKQVKSSMILSEIAEQEGLEVGPEELEVRIQLLKGQYSDQNMQAELDKQENRRDIASRMLSEKVLKKLEEYAAA